MRSMRPRVPVGLLIAVVALLILGAIAGPILRSLATPEQLASNVLLGAIPFILVFVAIVLAFISVIAFVASVLNHHIEETAYRPIERILIAGIVAGVIGMFQPWLHILYKIGFIVLLVSTLSFILWSHIVPRRIRRAQESRVISVGDLEDSGKD